MEIGVELLVILIIQGVEGVVDAGSTYSCRFVAD
jgi:hypothetical protein